jgi:hypothetical protein
MNERIDTKKSVGKPVVSLPIFSGWDGFAFTRRLFSMFKLQKFWSATGQGCQMMCFWYTYTYWKVLELTILVHHMAIWHALWIFNMFGGYLVFLSGFHILCQEKSGNPASASTWHNSSMYICLACSSNFIGRVFFSLEKNHLTVDPFLLVKQKSWDFLEKDSCCFKCSVKFKVAEGSNWTRSRFFGSQFLQLWHEDNREPILRTIVSYNASAVKSCNPT